MNSPFLYSKPWPRNMVEVRSLTPDELLALEEIEPPVDPEVAHWRRRAGQVQRLNATLAQEIDRLRRQYEPEAQR